MTRRVGFVTALLVGCALALIGCQGSPPPSGQDASAGSLATPGPSPGLVDVGGARQVFARCEGSGSSTVILISGQDMTSDAWRVVLNADATDVVESERAVFQQLAATTRVCAYDRGSTSWPAESRSTRVPQPVGADAAVRDLHAWLQHADAPSPYVLAGHSYGGMIAVLYAETYPDEVAGLVLVDPANRYLRDVVDHAWWASIQQQRLAAADPGGPEVADFDASADAIVAAAPAPPVPAVVLTSDASPPAMIDEQHFPAWRRAHDLLAAELGARHITQTNSGHNIQIEQPGLVVEAIRGVIATRESPSG